MSSSNTVYKYPLYSTLPYYISMFRFMRCLVLTLLPNVLVYLRLLTNSSSIRLSQVKYGDKLKKWKLVYKLIKYFKVSLHEDVRIKSNYIKMYCRHTILKYKSSRKKFCEYSWVSLMFLACYYVSLVGQLKSHFVLHREYKMEVVKIKYNFCGFKF